MVSIVVEDGMTTIAAAVAEAVAADVATVTTIPTTAAAAVAAEVETGIRTTEEAAAAVAARLDAGLVMHSCDCLYFLRVSRLLWESMSLDEAYLLA